MKKYAHFTENEITGEYYKDKMYFWKEFSFFLIGLGVTLMVLDQTVGAETVTNFIADLLGSLMN